MPSLIDQDFDAPITFQRRPIDIPGEMRPAWRIAFIVLMLHVCCRGKRSSIQRLHVFSWCNRSAQSSNLLTRALTERLAPGQVLVRIEPSLARAVDLAIGARLLERETKDRVTLTADGISFAEEIIEIPNLLEREKEWAAALGQRVTESFVNSIFHHGVVK